MICHKNSLPFNYSSNNKKYIREKMSRDDEIIFSRHQVTGIYSKTLLISECQFLECSKKKLSQIKMAM